MGLFPEVKLFVLNLNLSLKDESTDGGKGLFRKQASVFLHGASGAGKTTMLEKTTGKSQEELQKIERSFGNEPPRLIGKKGDFAFVIDSPGESSSKSEGIRIRSLNNLKPLAILLLLDHAPRGREDNPTQCATLCESDSHQSIQVKRSASQLKIQEHANRMGQHLADQAVLEMPHIVNSDACNGKAFRQV